MRKLLSVMFVAAITAGCPVEVDPKATLVESDDSDPISVDTSWEDNPPESGVYTITGTLLSQPLRLDSVGGDAYVLILSAVTGSLFIDQNYFTPIRCIGMDCRTIEFRSVRSYRCRVGDPDDWTGQEVCVPLPLPTDTDDEQDTDAQATPGETDASEDSDLPDDKDPGAP